jgi:hypothetical protein
MTAGTILKAYRLVFAGLIAVSSAQALLTAPEHLHHAFSLGAIEILGASLLVVARTQPIGAGVLLCAFALAQGLSVVTTGRWPTQYVQYAASTLVIVLLGRRQSEMT